MERISLLFTFTNVPKRSSGIVIAYLAESQVTLLKETVLPKS